MTKDSVISIATFGIAAIGAVVLGAGVHHQNMMSLGTASAPKFAIPAACVVMSIYIVGVLMVMRNASPIRQLIIALIALALCVAITYGLWTFRRPGE